MNHAAYVSDGIDKFNDKKEGLSMISIAKERGKQKNWLEEKVKVENCKWGRGGRCTGSCAKPIRVAKILQN